MLLRLGAILAVVMLSVRTLEGSRSMPAQLPRLACLSPDSATRSGRGLRFGSFTRDATTGDVVGTQFTFFVEHGHWSGTVTKAKGEIGEPAPLLAVTFALASQHLEFSYPAGVDTTTFRGRFSCTRLFGQFTFSPRQTVTLQVRRVR